MVPLTTENAGAGSPLFFLSAGVILKNERDYIEEWISYHYLLGFDHFFIFDNNSTDDIRGILAPYTKRGLVTLIDWPIFPGQVDAYSFACRLANGLTEWIAFIDVDEFVTMRAAGDLRQRLSQSDASQILVRWNMFGHSGHRERQPGLTTRAFVRRAPELSHIAKMFVRPGAVKAATVHYARLLPGHATVDAAGRPAREDWTLKTPQGGEAFVLNHYYTRSWEECVHKMHKGDSIFGKFKDLGTFDRWDFEDEERTAALQADAVEETVARIRDLPAQPLRYGGLGTAANAGTTQPFSLAARNSVEELVAEFADRLQVQRNERGSMARLPAGDGDEAISARWTSLVSAFSDRHKSLVLSDVQGRRNVGPDRPLTLDLPDVPLPGFVHVAFTLRTTDQVRLDWRVEGSTRDGPASVQDRLNVPGAVNWYGHYMPGDAPLRPRQLTLSVKRGSPTVRLDMLTVLLAI